MSVPELVDVIIDGEGGGSVWSSVGLGLERGDVGVPRLQLLPLTHSTETLTHLISTGEGSGRGGGEEACVCVCVC